MRINSFMLILYDTEEDQKILLYIKENYDYIKILHDKDIDVETGEIKKAHYHIIVDLPNARNINSIAKELNIAENRIEKIKNRKKAIRYLIHKDNKEKYKYKIEDIETNEQIEKYFKNKESEEEEINEVIEILKNKKYISYSEMVYRCIEKGIYKTLRRNQYIVKLLLEEHNRIYMIKGDVENEKRNNNI